MLNNWRLYEYENYEFGGDFNWRIYKRKINEYEKEIYMYIKLNENNRKYL